MKKMALAIVLIAGCFVAKSEEISLKITKKYLNIPISHQEDRKVMTIAANGEKERVFDVRLATSTADYWVFCDMAAYKGKTIKISYPAHRQALEKIYQADEIAGQDSMYKETNRPQLHFTPKRGWHNDPNGMIYYEGEYHLFFQHNPYEREWGNMHWGHAVSKDLIHWEELPVALYPDELGTMYSGSAVIDYRNTAGFNQGNLPAMVAVYTANSPERQVQCLAYSLDKGRTWTKYEGNPVIDSKEQWNSRDTRDPKVLWYAPNNEWVMVLNERDGHSIYTSPDLKMWKYESHITGFWECPELFELAVDGDKNNTKWVMYGASGTYMTGSFDGKKFMPESGKHYYTTGSLYAAQTFAHIPDSDGRRIQMGWGRITHPDMPFKSLMLLPTELTLRTTQEGIRLFNNPIKEIEQLQNNLFNKSNLSEKEANELLHPHSGSDCMRIQFTLQLSHATEAGLNLYGQPLLRYDMNYNLVNGFFYSPEDMTSMEITADVIIDKTSVEVFIDNGAFSYSMERQPDRNNKDGFRFWGNNIEVKELKAYSMKSIWK